MEASARNKLKGTILEIQSGVINGIVVIDLGNGNKISATVSMTAIEELALKVGAEAYALIKATSVMVGAENC